jgi:choline-glycine betaine transporter
MRGPKVLTLLIWAVVWGVLAAALAGLYVLAGSLAPNLQAHLVPFFLIDLLVVFPLASLAATPITRAAPKWSHSTRTRVREPLAAAGKSRDGGRQ